MFGLLGGLLGRAVQGGLARRPAGGGLLRGLINRQGQQQGGRLLGGGLIGRALQRRSGGMGQQQAPASFSSGPAPQTATAQPMQVQQETASPQPATQADQPLILIGPDGSQPAAQPQQTQQPQQVTSALLEESPVVEPQAAPMEGAPEPARQVANETEASSPVAQQADMAFGAVPQTMAPALEGLLDQDIPRRQFAAEDSNPSKPVDTKSQARHGQSGPQYNYQTAGSWTAATPTYSYRRS